ncbi:MAG: hypothetical protein AAF745_00210 [Planctomycetota bacterium]
MAHENASLPYLVPDSTYKLQVELDGTVTGTPTWALVIDGAESVAATGGTVVSGSLWEFDLAIPEAAAIGKSARVRIAAIVDGNNKKIDFHSAIATVLTKGYNLGDAGPADETQRYIVKSDIGNRVDGAEVWVTSDLAGQNMVAGILTTNDQGYVDLRLAPGETYYIWRQHEDYTFTNPVAFTVPSS